MKLIKRIEKDNFILEHHHSKDAIGSLVDNFNIIEENTGIDKKMYFAFSAPIRIAMTKKGYTTGLLPEFTDKEYKEILEEEMIKFKELKHKLRN